MNQSEVIKVYLDSMREIKKRILYAESQIDLFNKSNDNFILENAILHLRKVLECIAYASIAPNKDLYAKFRSNAQKPADFRKDYHGTKILEQLEKINKNFYPYPLIEPILVGNGEWHFDRLNSGYLTKNEYTKLYDKLGKFLHSDNPWGGNKGYIDLAKNMLENFQKIKLLLQIHATFVQDGKSIHSFIIDMGSESRDVSIIIGYSGGTFKIDYKEK